ncbi:tyrosine-type recombinase/integrase [Schaalia hyovaginalis]|nr:tyrosine-type recombinase/integrase [Schaalia hyovaginalis]
MGFISTMPESRDVARNADNHGSSPSPGKKRGRRPKRWTGFGSRKQLNSGRWQASFPDPTWTGDGRAPRILAPHTFRLQGEAEQWLIKVGAEVAAGTWKHPDAVKAAQIKEAREAEAREMTVEEWGTEYIRYGREVAKWARKTIQKREGILENHVYPTFKTTRIVDVTDEDVTEWYQRLPDGMKATCYQTMNAMMNLGVKSKKCPLTSNPCQVPRGGKPIPIKPPKYLFADHEIDAIADAIYPRGRALVLLEADAGLRINEALALTRDCIELDTAKRTGVVRVLHSLHREGSGLALGDTKTHKRRDVYLAPDTVDALAAHLDEFTGPAPKSPVFTTSTRPDSFMRDNTATKWLETALKAAEVTIPEDRSAGWHAFRHYSATRFGQAGATTAALLDRYGWTKPEMAMRYQRQDADYQREIVSNMAERKRANTMGEVADLDAARNRRMA